MTLVIIDYGSGNLRSAAKAFERAAQATGFAPAIKVTADPQEVLAADRVVLPGVGAFGDCRAGLDAIDGLVPALREVVEQKARPFFGICVGMQLMATQGLEHGTHEGFGWIPGVVDLIRPADETLKIPHMGWNNLTLAEPHPVFEGLDATNQDVYFVHSYVMRPKETAHVLARADYGGAFVAAVGRDNMIGTQFHPEKSQGAGLALIERFLKWNP